MTYEMFKTTYGAALNEQQARAVQAVDGPVLLLAVPGSGKTTVLVERLGYMVLGRGIPPEHILTMTYTVAATRDMRRRFASQFGEELAARLEFRTINGVSARVIGCYERMYQRKAFELLGDEGELAALVGEIYRSIAGEFPTESDIKAIRTAITYAKNQMLTAEQIEKMGEELKHLPAIYREYNRVLRDRGRMDYDDQMVYAHQILRQYPEVLAVFQRRYRYLCVDEAQDTSKIQHQIIRLLAQGSGNLFMVGDEDQSIYGFRAACPQALLEFEQGYPGASVLLMEQNYRSTPQIVQAADRFIQKNKHRRPKHMTAARPEGHKVIKRMLNERRDQYAYLLNVARTCDRETAVLYRDNDCALPLIDLLEREGVPYRCRQMDSAFFSHRVVRDLTDLLHLSQDPCDREAFLRVYYKLSAGIKKEFAQAAVARCTDGTPLFTLLSQDAGLSEWSRERCRSIQTHLQAMKEERGDRAVYRILNAMGYGDYLEKRGMDPNRAHILQALGEREPTPRRLLERLEELRFLLEHRTEDRDCPFLLSTIHSSKGLEYERVLLMDVIDGILPKLGEGVEADEERRLFYVGMTRARDELTVFAFQSPRFRSAFSEEVFLERKPEAGARRWEASRPPRPAADPADFVPGCKVRHRSFGVGTVLTRSGDMLETVFSDGSQRKLSLTAAVQAGALECLERPRTAAF